MLKDGMLTRMDTAFSRDQAEKIYVQDRMQENAAELYAGSNAGRTSTFAAMRRAMAERWSRRCWTRLRWERRGRRNMRRSIWRG